MNKRYNNYHKHDHKGNVRSLDVVVKLEDYCKRAKELGHTTIFTTNHGMQGDIFEAITLAKQYDLKLIMGYEGYYVEDRHEQDRSNKHIVIIALNNDGAKELNKIISIANDDGFYYKPRIDYKLLMSINPNNFIVTTACVAGILKDEELIKELKNKFKNNFFLEVQNHNEDIQKEYNKLALEYSKKYNIKIIHGNDSHYIYPQDSKYRDLFLKAKGIIYENENNFILDYPDYDTIVERYKKQGILNDEEITQAINNTLIFDKAEELTFINKEIKLPSIVDNPNRFLKEILANSWTTKLKTINNNKINEYIDAIRYETKIVEDTHMEDYFILDYEIAKLAQSKYNTKLTNTGRGSAPSFYINNLLGLTNIDRLESPIKLFPTRFMSVERILGARSLPDIDLNTSNAEGFIQATKDLLGEDKCAWMIAWKPLQEASAFRLYCKSLDMNISEYDEVAKNLDNYKEDDKWKGIIEESKHFVGVIESISESPCSMLLGINNIAENVGLIKVKNKMLCLLDGYNCDKYKYLKNDYLTVSIWGIIKDVCEMANINIPTIKKLNNLLDDKTWAIYEKGLTCTINQADSDFATGLIKKYKPKNISELSQFVAMIRPGCASLLNDFIDRKPYTTGVKELDDLLEDSEHRMIYQESIMKYLIWLGVKETQSYDIIKKIAKKKFKEKELKELKEQLIKGWINNVGSEKGFEETWKVVQDASLYSFNSSHSLSYAYDSVYGAYLKSHYPLEYYSVVLNYYIDDETRTNKLIEETKYFNIKIKNPQFRYSKGGYFCDKQTNTIYKGIGSIKFCNETIGDELYGLKDNEYKNFFELLIDINKTSINSRQLEILIKLNFFSEFGKTAKLLRIVDLYNNIYTKKQFKKDKLGEETYNLIKKYAQKETPKQFSQVDTAGVINEIIPTLINEDLPIKELMLSELEYIGYITYTDKTYDKDVVTATEVKINKWGTPYITLYCLNNGQSQTLKTDKKYFIEKPISQYDTIVIKHISEKNKRRKVDGKWTISDEKEYILDAYARVI